MNRNDRKTDGNGLKAMEMNKHKQKWMGMNVKWTGMSGNELKEWKCWDSDRNIWKWCKKQWERMKTNRNKGESMQTMRN